MNCEKIELRKTIKVTVGDVDRNCGFTLMIPCVSLLITSCTWRFWILAVLPERVKILPTTQKHGIRSGFF